MAGTLLKKRLQKQTEPGWNGIWGLYKSLQCLDWVVLLHNYPLSFWYLKLPFSLAFPLLIFNIKKFHLSLTHPFFILLNPLTSLTSQSLSLLFFLSQIDSLNYYISTFCSNFSALPLNFLVPMPALQKVLGQTQWPFYSIYGTSVSLSFHDTTQSSGLSSFL